MGRDVAGLDLPFFRAVGVEAVEFAGGNIVPGVGHEDLARRRVHRNAVRNGDPPVRAVGDEIPGHDLFRPHVDDGIADRVALCGIAPLRAVHIERIAADGHLAVGEQLELVGHLVRAAVDNVGPRRRVVVVAARGDPDLSVGIQLHAVQVDRHVDLLHLPERVEVDDRDRAVVVGHAVAARIGDIELLADDHHLFGLVADRAGPDDLHGGRVDLRHVPQPRIGVDLNRPGIRTDIGIPSLEDDVAAVGNGDLRDVAGGPEVHHLDEVRAVDHGVELPAVDLQVVAHVAQLLHHARIAFGVDVFRVDARGVVEVVERRLVAAHVALVEQEKAADPLFAAVLAGGIAGRRNGGRGRGNDRLLLAAGRQQRCRREQKKHLAKGLSGCHNIQLMMSFTFVPGIG